MMTHPGAGETVTSNSPETNKIVGKFKKLVPSLDLFGTIKSTIAVGNIAGWDKQNEADYLLAYERASRGNKFKIEFHNSRVARDLREQTPEFVNILVEEFGRDWDTNPETPEGVLKQAWYMAEASSRREVHGYEVNSTLRKYWEKPQFRENGQERIYLPEDETTRQELFEHAVRYQSASIDTKARMAGMIREIADAKGYALDSPEIKLVREKLTRIWEHDEIERSGACAYLGKDEGTVLNLYDVDHAIQKGLIPELPTIAEKIVEIAHVDNSEALLTTVGIEKNEYGRYQLSAAQPKSGALLLVRGRMGQRQHIETAQKCWETIPAGSEKNADIVLMNAIALESLAKMETMGREIVVGEVYRARGIELLDDGQKRSLYKIKNTFSQVVDITKKGDLRTIFMYFTDSMREANELYYGLAVSISHIFRLKTHDSGSYMRRSGENIARWIDRVSLSAAVSVDQVFAKFSNRGQRRLNQTQAFQKSGKVDIDLPNVSSKEEAK